MDMILILLWQTAGAAQNATIGLLSHGGSNSPNNEETMKVRDFNYKQPALCKDCKGSGYILESGLIGDIHRECPTCKGSGKVWITKAGTVTITPYTE